MFNFSDTRSLRKQVAKWASLAFAVTMFAGCGGSLEPIPATSGGGDSIMGGGSSFAYPIMNRWASDYYKANNVQVNYQSLGSSGGIKQFSVKTLDFGATDTPMNAEQLAEAADPVVHIPVVIGAVAVAYNLPEISENLTLNGQVLADIYLDKITKWNDPAIVALNPTAALPDADIVTTRRADGSGTTYIFADFLAQTSPEWKEKVGVGNSLNWPGESIGNKGNEGVSAFVQRTPNSIGYVELIYATEANMPVAAIVNSTGAAILPSKDSVTAAAAELADIPEDLCVNVTNAPGAEAYPLAGLTWVVAREQMDNADKAEALNAFLKYVLSDEGQETAVELQYSKLPAKLLGPTRKKASKISGKR